MNSTAIKTNQTPIILSRGIFDLLKDHIKRKKLSRYNELKLELELRSARQVLRRELPETIVSIDRKVKVRELDLGKEYTYNLVAENKAKEKIIPCPSCRQLAWLCWVTNKEPNSIGRCPKA